MNQHISHLRADIIFFQQRIKVAQSEITRLQSECPHSFQVHSQHLRSQESGKWWIHRVCTCCEASDTSLAKYPECPSCNAPLVPIFIDDERTLAARAKAREADSIATIDFAFACHTCDKVHGFAFRGEKKV